MNIYKAHNKRKTFSNELAGHSAVHMPPLRAV